MPVAVPAIAAAAAAYGATAALGGAAAVAAMGIGGTLIVSGAALAASTAVGALMAKKPASPDAAVSFDAGGGGRTFQVRQPTAPHDVVVGRVKKSGPIAFMHTMADDTGRENGYFYIQLALAAHPCAHIGDVWINDEFSTAEKFSGFARFGKNLGSVDQVEDADFLAELGEIFAGHRGQGIANLAARLKGNAAAFPQGLPNLSTIVWGVNQVYDPRTRTTGWTNNAALVFAWWKTWEQGQKVAWEDIDEDTLIDSANVCDQRVPVLGGAICIANATANSVTLTSGRALDVGDGVRFTSTGTLPSGISADTTYYMIPAADGAYQLALSVAGAFAREAIDIGDAGTGTHTCAYHDEARWKVNGTFTLDQDKDTIRSQLLSAMMGTDVEVGGKWFIHAATPTLPTVTIDEDDFAGTMITRPKRSTRDKFNGVRARYIDPAMNWQPTDAPPWSHSGYVAEDNGVVLWEEVEFPFTISRTQVQRSMKLHLERNRRQRTVQFQAMFTGVPLRPMQGVYLDYERFGWIQQQFIVVGWKLNIPAFTVDLVLQEDDADVYAWSVEDEIAMSDPQDVTLPDASAIPAPPSLTVVTPALTFTSLTAEWEPAPSALAMEYEREYRLRGESDWTSLGKIGSDATLNMTVPNAEPTDFRVRALSTHLVPSAWVEALAPLDPTDVVSADDNELSWTVPAGAASIELWKAGVLHDDIAAAAVGTPQTATSLSAGIYRIRAKSAEGNVSNESAEVTVSGGGGE